MRFREIAQVLCVDEDDGFVKSNLLHSLCKAFKTTIKTKLKKKAKLRFRVYVGIAPIIINKNRADHDM